FSVATDSAGDVFVTDFFNNRVQKFDNTGNFLTAFGSSGSGNGQFMNPYGVAVDSSGNVFVTDFNGDRFEEFTNSGSFLTAFGTAQLNAPEGVAVDASDKVFVADAGNDRVAVFAPEAVIPEPSSLTLLAVGGCLAYLRWRRRLGNPVSCSL